MICSRTFEDGQQLAVVVVEDDVLDADAASGLLRLGPAPRGERARRPRSGDRHRRW